MKNFLTLTRDMGEKLKDQESNFRYNLEAYQVLYYHNSYLWSFSDISAILIYIYLRYTFGKENGYFESI